MLDEYIAQGLMPNLQHLVETGTSGRLQTQPPALAREADSVKTEFRPVEPGEFPVYQGNLLERGKVAFEASCSACHSTVLVWQSGMHAGEIDSTVTAMLAKKKQKLEPEKQESLVRFLATRFPRN